MLSSLSISFLFETSRLGWLDGGLSGGFFIADFSLIFLVSSVAFSSIVGYRATNKSSSNFFSFTLSYCALGSLSVSSDKLRGIFIVPSKLSDPKSNPSSSLCSLYFAIKTGM
jgi:hypothetical protein